MLSIILSILIFPIMSVSLYGNAIIQNYQWPGLDGGPKVVKGEEVSSGNNQDFSQSVNDDLENCSLFSADQSASGYMPVMRPGISDLKLWDGSSVAIDVDSGTLLHYDNGRKRAQIASLTKMITAILAVENIKDLNEAVTITPDARAVDGTVVGCPTSGICPTTRLQPSEKVRAIDLLKVMLLNSANDAATALGTHIAGSADKFVDMMNQKAQTLGLEDTHFCTPSGLEIDGQEDQCYSSAYDIARIAVYSLKYNLIWDIMRTPDGQFSSIDGKYTHIMKNTDLLLDTIPNCLGGKTGFTPLAGKSLMMGSVDPTGKHRVIAVILNDPDRWDDMKTLIDWVYGSYVWK